MSAYSMLAVVHSKSPSPLSSCWWCNVGVRCRIDSCGSDLLLVVSFLLRNLFGKTDLSRLSWTRADCSTGSSGVLTKGKRSRPKTSRAFLCHIPQLSLSLSSRQRRRRQHHHHVVQVVFSCLASFVSSCLSGFVSSQLDLSQAQLGWNGKCHILTSV